MGIDRVSFYRNELRQRYPEIPFPDQSYLILMSPRSGSTLLCAHLEKIGHGRPTEGFHFSQRALVERFGNKVDFSDPYQHIIAALRYGTVNGVYGLKLSWVEFEVFLQKARALIGKEAENISDAEILEVFFPSAKYLRLERKDKIKQAISYSKAMQTGIWNEPTGTSEDYRDYVLPAQYNRDHIEALLDNLLAFDLSWQRFLTRNCIPAFEIVYEDLAKNYVSAMTAICEYLGVENIETLEPPMKRLSDKISQEWYERFVSETAWLKDPDIQQCLEEGDFASLFFLRSRMMSRTREREIWKKLPYNRNKSTKRLIYRIQKRFSSK